MKRFFQQLIEYAGGFGGPGLGALFASVEDNLLLLLLSLTVLVSWTRIVPQSFRSRLETNRLACCGIRARKQIENQSKGVG